MKKLIISLLLLICPLAQCLGQISISGVTGNDGYSVLRTSLAAEVPFVPGLSVTPGYSVYQKDGMQTMSQYSLGAGLKLPLINLAKAEVSGGYIPKANGYSSYFYDIGGALDLETLFLGLLPTDDLQLGGGVKNTFHSYYNPDQEIRETDLHASLSQKTGDFESSVNFSKAISYSKETKDFSPPWLDVKNFTAVYSGYLDYSAGANASYTLKFLRPYVSYNFLKTKNTDFSTDNAQAGIVIKCLMVELNAAMEWFNFTRNTAQRKSFFSLTAGVSFP